MTESNLAEANSAGDIDTWESPFSFPLRKALQVPDPTALATRDELSETLTLKQWRELLDAYLAHAQAQGRAHSRRKKIRTLATFTLAALTACSMVSCLAASGHTTFIVLPFLFLIAAALVFRIKLPKPISVDSLLTTAPLLHALTEESGTDALVAFRLTLGTLHPHEKLQRWPTITRADGSTREHTTKLDPWWSGATEFPDGARLTWKIVDRFDRFSTIRPNNKSKHKSRCRHLISVALSAPTARYSLRSPPVAAPSDRVRVKQGTKRCMVRLDRSLELLALDSNQSHIDHLLDLIAGAYRQLTPRSP